jgi:hypothetical protein
MTLLANKRKVLRVGLLSGLMTGLLAACGGGGTTGQGISGRVMDGYIKGAIVCLDVNANGVCNSDEPQAETTTGGVYALNVPSDAQLGGTNLLVEVPVGAIDEDTPNTPIATAYVMRGVASAEAVVSPLTTVLAAHLDNGETEAEALTAMGLSGVDLKADYVASGNTQVHNAAKLLARNFQAAGPQTAAQIRARVATIKASLQTAHATTTAMSDDSLLALVPASSGGSITSDVVFASGYGEALDGLYLEGLSVYRQGLTNEEGGIFGWGISPDADIWGDTWSGVAPSSHNNGAFFNWGTWNGALPGSDYIESWVMRPEGVDITGMGRISLKVWGNKELSGVSRFTPSLVSMPIGDCSPTAEYDGALVAASVDDNNDLVDQSAASFQLSFNDFVITENCSGQITSMADFVANDLKTVRIRIYKANTNSVAGINVGPISLKP